MKCRCKDLNEVLNKCFTQDCDFPDYEDKKHFFIAAVGNHGKRSFNMLINIFSEACSSSGPIYFDEEMGKFDSTKDETQVTFGNSLERGLFKMQHLLHFLKQACIYWTA